MMESAHKSALEYIYDTAIWKAKDAAEDKCMSSCSEWMDIAKDAEHIMRKEEEWELMKSSPEMMAHLHH